MSTAEAKSDDRLEQKIAFAQRYFTAPNDSIIHAAKVLSDEAIENPMLAINFGNAWPFDPVVIQEVERLKNKTKPRAEYEALALKLCYQCMDRGEEPTSAKFFEIAATLAGHINQRTVNAKDSSGNGEGRLADLLAMLDPENVIDNGVDNGTV